MKDQDISRECCENPLKPISAEVMTHVYALYSYKHILGALSVKDHAFLAATDLTAFCKNVKGSGSRGSMFPFLLHRD